MSFTKLLRKYPKLRRKFITSEKSKWKNSLELYKSVLPVFGTEKILCFDIGSHIGKVSEVLLALGHKVISFEPNNDLIAELEARCSGYRSWILCQLAVGRTPGLANLYIRDYPGQASLLDQWGQGAIKGMKYVPVLPLKLLIEHFGVPSFIKVDVEGYEFDVLDSLAIPIDLISFEFHLIDSMMQTTLSCLKKIDELGEYEVNVCDGDDPQFFSQEWIDIGTFIDNFSMGVREAYSMKIHYADIYCRRKRAPR